MTMTWMETLTGEEVKTADLNIVSDSITKGVHRGIQKNLVQINK